MNIKIVFKLWLYNGNIKISITCVFRRSIGVMAAHMEFLHKDTITRLRFTFRMA